MKTLRVQCESENAAKLTVPRALLDKPVNVAVSEMAEPNEAVGVANVAICDPWSGTAICVVSISPCVPPFVAS